MSQSKNHNLVLILPKAFDFTAAVVVEGLNRQRVGYCVTVNSNGAKNADPALARDLLKDGTRAVACTGLGLDSDLCKLAVATGGLIVVDGSDHSDFLDVQRLGINPSSCAAIYKREYLRSWSRESKPNVVPFPMAITQDCLQAPQKKTLLLSMLCNPRTNPIRAAVADWLRVNAQEPRIAVGTTNECAYDPWKPKADRIETPNYRNLLAASLASINLPGAGFDCKRYWEIAGAKSLIVSQELEIEIPHDFVNKAEKLEFRSLSELDGIIKFLSRNPNSVVEMINRATERAEKFHTSEKRVEPLLERCFGK